MFLREFGVNQQLLKKCVEVHTKPGCVHLAALENQIKTTGLRRTCIFSCNKLENSVLLISKLLSAQGKSLLLLTAGEISPGLHVLLVQALSSTSVCEGPCGGEE